MHRQSTGRRLAWALVFVTALADPRPAGSDEPAPPSASAEMPASLTPFEYLIGGWKGVGAPSANRVRGWTESHAWAWAFEKGRPVGLTAELTGNKVLKSLRLTQGPAAGQYTLRGTDPSGNPAVFTGGFDKGGKTLQLDREGTTPDGAKQRLTLFPNANAVRYTLWVSEQPRGAPRLSKTIETGVTKVGESFAAGAGAADLPKCVVTGGAATLTVSYQGKSFPLCCTGCRDEFNENPEKYVKKAALRSGSAPREAPAGPSPEPEPPAPGSPGTAPDPAVDEPAETPARALTLLTIGQNLEKSGKPRAALDYYRQIVKEYPDTPPARTAAGRIKALGGRPG